MTISLDKRPEPRPPKSPLAVVVATTGAAVGNQALAEMPVLGQRSELMPNTPRTVALLTQDAASTRRRSPTTSPSGQSRAASSARSLRMPLRRPPAERRGVDQGIARERDFG